jgi:cytochrome c oxidase subunit 1
MPRRYATYETTVAGAPIDLMTLAHQSASAGAVLLALGQLIFVVNIVQSWLEGPTFEDGDPWDLKDTGQHGREFQWHERRQETAITDGGEPEEGEAVTDGGEPADDATESGTDPGRAGGD